MNNPTQAAVARQQQAGPNTANTLFGVIDRMRPQIAEAVPQHITADRVARIASTIIRKDQLAGGHLWECTPESFAGALITASVMGLEPGINNEAHLVAYKNKRNGGKYECQLIIGYQGMAKLFFQHPLAQNLSAEAVHENDEFDYAYGTVQYLKHKPVAKNRGPVVAYYAIATLKSGAQQMVVLTPDEVKVLRGGKVGPSGDIPDPQHWMERKTVLKQALKLSPKSATLNRAIEADEKPGGELHTELVVERLSDAPPLDQRPDVPGDQQQAVEQAPPAATAPPEPQAPPADPDEPPLPEPPAEWHSAPAEPDPVTPPAPATPAAAAMPMAMRPTITSLFKAREAEGRRFEIMSQLLDRPITAYTDLTQAEGQAVIDTIESMTPFAFRDAFGDAE